MTKIRRPCANCPWRVDAPRGYWDPLHFVEIWRNCQDDGLRLMACHKSTPDAYLPCQGWIRVVGVDAIGVRLALIQGTVAQAEVDDRLGPVLFPSFTAMLKANGIPRLPRNRLKGEV